MKAREPPQPELSARVTGYKPKPRRTRAKKAEGDEAAPAKKPRAPRKSASKPAAKAETKEQLTDDIAVVAGPEETPADPQKAAQDDKAGKADEAGNAAPSGSVPAPQPSSGEAPGDDSEENDSDGKPRRGWWQRTFG